jgi:hypothetical protein
VPRSFSINYSLKLKAMNDEQTEHVGMFIKVKTFLNKKTASLASTPIVDSTIKPAFLLKIDEIEEEDQDASSTISGDTEVKRLLRQSVQQKGFTVAAAVVGYYTIISPEPRKRQKCEFERSDLDSGRMRDNDLYVNIKHVHEIADPIKNQLAAFGVSDTDVDDLATVLTGYFTELQAPRDAIGERAASGKQVDRLIEQAMEILRTQLDVAMKVYVHRDPELYDYYQNARSIDQTGGGSVPDEDEEITIPAGQWLNAPLPPEITASSRIVVTSKAANTNQITVGISVFQGSYSGAYADMAPGQTEDREATAWGYAGPGNYLVVNNTYGPVQTNSTIRVKIYY